MNVTEQELEEANKEARAIWTMWAWIKVFGGTLNQFGVVLNHTAGRRVEVFNIHRHGDEWQGKAVAWITERQMAFVRGQR